MSDERWADPRSAFRALSNGPTFETIAALVPELFPIQLVSAAVSATWSGVSHEVGPDPRSAFRALSNGPTFETIAALVPELFPIQLVSATV
jgi:hypothetical protein